MAKIVEANVEDGEILESEGLRILIERPTRRGDLVWGAAFAVMLMTGAMLGLGFANGSFSNSIQVAQNAFSADGTNETATN